MTNLIRVAVTFWRSLDEKLKATILAFVVVQAAALVGLNPDELLELVGISVPAQTGATVLAAIAAAVAGYLRTNAGTILRNPAAIVPADSGGLTDAALAELERVGHEPAGAPGTVTAGDSGSPAVLMPTTATKQ